MPGRPSSRETLRYAGALAAVIALIGSLAFGWRFGGADGAIPYALGVVCVGIAVWGIYRRA